MESSGPSVQGLDLYSEADYSQGEPRLEGSLSAQTGQGSAEIIQLASGLYSSPRSVGGPEFNTLDEPIKETIMRDLGAVASKFYHVLYPK
jgi:hypothetical protein